MAGPPASGVPGTKRSRPPRWRWRVEHGQGETLITFQGKLDDQFSFPDTELRQPRVVFDLAEVERISSAGVGYWVQFLRRAKIEQLIFRRCSIAVVAQINMVPDFQGGATVESVYAPYICEARGDETMHLLELEGLDLDNPPELQTDEGLFVFDDIPERYFAFLRPERRRPGRR